MKGQIEDKLDNAGNGSARFEESPSASEGAWKYLP